MARPKKIIELEAIQEPKVEAINQAEPSGKSGELVCIEIGSGATYCNCLIDISQLEAHTNAGWRVKPPNFGG